MNLIAAAWGAEIQVEASRPVVVAIDGRPRAVAGTRVDTHDLPAGPHHIQVRSFVGSLLAETVVRVADHERLSLIYDRDDRTLTELTRVPIVSDSDAMTEPEAPEPPTDAEPSEPAATPEPVDVLPRTKPPATSDSSTGSVMVTGVPDISGTVTISGFDVEFASEPYGFLATGLTPPIVEVHIEDNGKLRFHGAVDVTPGGHQSCHLYFLETAWTLRCEHTGPELQ